jgi:hypothetical protein
MIFIIITKKYKYFYNINIFSLHIKYIDMKYFDFFSLFYLIIPLVFTILYLFGYFELMYVIVIWIMVAPVSIYFTYESNKSLFES